jgi:hypothetical protein
VTLKVDSTNLFTMKIVCITKDNLGKWFADNCLTVGKIYDAADYYKFQDDYFIIKDNTGSSGVFISVILDH